MSFVVLSTIMDRPDPSYSVSVSVTTNIRVEVQSPESRGQIISRDRVTSKPSGSLYSVHVNLANKLLLLSLRGASLGNPQGNNLLPFPFNSKCKESGGKLSAIREC